MKINSFVDITIYKADYYFALQIIVYFLIINRLIFPFIDKIYIRYYIIIFVIIFII